MKLRLQQLSQRAVALIKDPSVSDPAVIARLGPIPAKLQRMELQFEELEQEANQVEDLIDNLAHKPRRPNDVAEHELPTENDFPILSRRGAQTKLRVEIDGAILGRPGTTRAISEHKASDTLVRCLTLLYEAKGISVLEKLSTLRVNRGPFVSKQPTVDYRNASKADELYQFQPISNSGYHVLTTNTTREKADNLIRTPKFLGFPLGSIKAEVVEK
jgi:hypothetical protein